MSDKPFACKVPGCNQKFVNEDHLEVHRKKHDASLGIINLKSLDTPVIADQTPTPTRFLKNLNVDDGLFTDLHSSDLHPNPFDAEFRKASTKLGSTSDDPADEPLSSIEAHVPDDSQVSNEIVLGGDVKVEVVTSSSQSLEPPLVADIGPGDDSVSSETSQQGPTTIVVMSKADQPAQLLSSQAIQLQALSTRLAPLAGIPLNGPIMIKLPTGQTIPVLPPSVTNPQVPIPTAVSANPSKEPEGLSRGGAASKNTQNIAVKQKLKTTLLSNQSQGNMNVMAQAVDVVTRQQQEVVTMHLMDDPHSLKRQGSESDNDDPDTKRQKFLERNRAAAMRCRNKRKQWIVDLEKRAEDLTSTNSTLSNEVSKLRNEVAQLKELLLAHKDCPVTLQQRAAGLFSRVGELPSKHEPDATTVMITSINPS